MRTIEKIFVHCTATPPATTVASIEAGFARQGWHAPGYHYLVRANGNIVKLLDDLYVANGVKGHNATSLHVAYIGGIDAAGRPADTRTAAQKSALVTLLRLLLGRYPAAAILGHRDISPDVNGNGRVDSWERLKECPCFDAAEEYCGLRPVKEAV